MSRKNKGFVPHSVFVNRKGGLLQLAWTCGDPDRRWSARGCRSDAIQDSLAQHIKARLSIHLALLRFQRIEVTFRRTSAPRQRQTSRDGRVRQAPTVPYCSQGWYCVLSSRI